MRDETGYGLTFSGGLLKGTVGFLENLTFDWKLTGEGVSVVQTNRNVRRDTIIRHPRLPWGHRVTTYVDYWDRETGPIYWHKIPS